MSYECQASRKQSITSSDFITFFEVNTLKPVKISFNEITAVAWLQSSESISYALFSSRMLVTFISSKITLIKKKAAFFSRQNRKLFLLQKKKKAFLQEKPFLMVFFLQKVWSKCSCVPSQFHDLVCHPVFFVLMV